MKITLCLKAFQSFRRSFPKQTHLIDCNVSHINLNLRNPKRLHIIWKGRRKTLNQIHTPNAKQCTHSHMTAPQLSHTSIQAQVIQSEKKEKNYIITFIFISTSAKSTSFKGHILYTTCIRIVYLQDRLQDRLLWVLVYPHHILCSWNPVPLLQRVTFFSN